MACAVALQVKDCVGEQVQQLVPSLVNNGIAAHVPPMIEEVRHTADTVAKLFAVRLVGTQKYTSPPAFPGPPYLCKQPLAVACCQG
jgi:hypothetical protein